MINVIVSQKTESILNGLSLILVLLHAQTYMNLKNNLHRIYFDFRALLLELRPGRVRFMFCCCFESKSTSHTLLKDEELCLSCYSKTNAISNVCITVFSSAEEASGGQIQIWVEMYRPIISDLYMYKNWNIYRSNVYKISDMCLFV